MDGKETDSSEQSARQITPEDVLDFLFAGSDDGPYFMYCDEEDGGILIGRKATEGHPSAIAFVCSTGLSGSLKPDEALLYCLITKRFLNKVLPTLNIEHIVETIQGIGSSFEELHAAYTEIKAGKV